MRRTEINIGPVSPLEGREGRASFRPEKRQGETDATWRMN
jgi:hypothetical protein